jgi:3-phenylpropionate/trans-cinnamate dioxygenase ferredoxin reductase subunit
VAKERAVIVGASLAGVRAAESLRARGFEGTIALVGAEQELPYHRPPLSKEMLGAAPIPADELQIQPRRFFDENAIELHLGSPAIAVDVQSRTVTLASRNVLPFDKLLIATGASPRPLDVPGRALEGVLSLRTLGDSEELRERLQRANTVLVIGAGLLGLEVAAAARTLGKDVRVVEQSPTPLSRVFHPELARRVVDLHRRRGVHVSTSAGVEALEGELRVSGARLRDGTWLSADLVVVAIGTTPNTSWLRRSGITLADGVIVNELGMTRIPGIYAAGDVARVYSRVIGDHVRFEQSGHASEQGISVSRVMTGDNHAFAGVPSASTVVYGVRAQSFGLVRPDLELILRGNDDRLLGFVLAEGAVVGSFAFNRAREFGAAKQLVLARATVPRRMLEDEAVPLIELGGAAR